MKIKPRGVGPRKGTPVSNRTNGEALLKQLRRRLTAYRHVLVIKQKDGTITCHGVPVSYE